MPDHRPSSFDVPDQTEAPVVWDPQARTFVPVGGPAVPGTAVASSSAPTRQWFIGTDAVGKAPPPRLGSPPVAATAAAAAAPPAAPSPHAPPPQPAAPPQHLPLARPAVQPQQPQQPQPAARPPAGPRRRRRWPRLLRLRRPKLRWIFAFVGLLPLLLVVGGFLYANHVFGKVDRVQVGEVLDPVGGGGTNYLIVGSDSREAVAAAGEDNPDVQPGGEAPAGQRSDTMLLLRIQPDGARMLSIPRDLFVTDAATGEQGRINGAYRDGPANLIRTVQQNLSVPVHRYIEVDFVTFSSLVDALGGITLGPDVVPNAAFDDRSGLNIGPGPVELDGRMALAFVRSRQYTEVIDGREVTDPTGDLGRVTRQQAFLRTVMAKAGDSRNPLTLLRVASSVTGGLRIDDEMSLLDAARFAWNMGRLDPESAVLPTTNHRTSGGAAVLLLQEEPAEGVLAAFR